MSNRLINKLLENYPYHEEFQEDLNAWQLSIETYIEKLKIAKRGIQTYPINSDSINQYKLDKVINATISYVGVISYTYGTIGREDDKEYKKIHVCKYIASFMYYFMLYLPFEPKNISEQHDIRKLNAIFARVIGLLMKQKFENDETGLKANMEKKLYDEFIYSLVNNYFKTPEELYLFCRAFNH